METIEVTTVAKSKGEVLPLRWVDHGLKAVALAVLLALLAACGDPKDDPRSQIEALLARASQAAETGDAAAIAELLYSDYSDERGRDAGAVVAEAERVFAQYNALYSLYHISAFTLPQPDRSELTVIAAVAIQPIESANLRALMESEGRILRFDLVVVDPYATANGASPRRPGGRPNSLRY